MGIPIIKIRRSWDRLIFIMGIPLLVRWHLYIETTRSSQYELTLNTPYTVIKRELWNALCYKDVWLYHSSSQWQATILLRITMGLSTSFPPALPIPQDSATIWNFYRATEMCPCKSTRSINHSAVTNKDNNSLLIIIIFIIITIHY